MQQYQLKQSPALNLFTIFPYCLVVITVIAFLHHMILLSGSLTLLVALLLFREQSRYRRLKSLDPTIITLRDSTARIELNLHDDHLQFDNFRLFSNRWFLILQMRNEQVSKNIILLSDRFITLNQYLSFRYQIINMSRNQHAA
jgi:hypothetical protein